LHSRDGRLVLSHRRVCGRERQAGRE